MTMRDQRGLAGAPIDVGALERAGAEAAAHGDSWHSNPFLRKENMPRITFEPLRDWACRHDAWQRGFEGLPAGPIPPGARQSLPADLLSELVQQRLRDIPAVRLEIRRNRWCAIHVARASAHPRDAAGRNWDVGRFDCGTLDEESFGATFRTIVDALRDNYDLT